MSRAPSLDTHLQGLIWSDMEAACGLASLYFSPLAVLPCSYQDASIGAYAIVRKKEHEIAEVHLMPCWENQVIDVGVLCQVWA